MHRLGVLLHIHHGHGTQTVQVAAVVDADVERSELGSNLIDAVVLAGLVLRNSRPLHGYVCRLRILAELQADGLRIVGYPAVKVKIYGHALQRAQLDVDGAASDDTHLRR